MDYIISALIYLSGLAIGLGLMASPFLAAWLAQLRYSRTREWLAEQGRNAQTEEARAANRSLIRHYDQTSGKRYDRWSVIAFFVTLAWVFFVFAYWPAISRVVWIVPSIFRQDY